MTDEPDSLEQSVLERIGRTLCDKWTLEALLGFGGVAAVYAARHRNGRRVAVKVLHPELAVDSRMKARFLREGYVANKVAHPGAVAVLDDAVDKDGSVLLVMELLEGETFEGRCRRAGGRLDPAEALAIVHSLLDILGAAHRAEILHRDVTAANVFITSGGEVKLLDFGIARVRVQGEEPVTGSVPGALGTPGYMPVEQARGLWKELDARTDLWAVGALLHRGLVGEPVHRGRTPSEALLAAMTQPARPLVEALPGAPRVLAELVDRALRVDKAGRFPDADTFRQAVDEAYFEITGARIERAELSPTPVGSAEPLVRSARTDAPALGTTLAVTPRPKRFRALGFFLLAVIGLAGVALLASRHTAEPVKPTLISSRAEPIPSSPAAASSTPSRVTASSPLPPTPSAPTMASSAPSLSAPPVKPQKGLPKPRSEEDVLDQRK